MAGTAHVFPHAVYLIETKAISLTADTIKIGLVASGTVPDTAHWETYQFVSDFLTNATFPQTEVSTSGTGYSRQTLTGLSVTPSGAPSGLTVTWTFTNPSWASSTISAVRAFFFDSSIGGGVDSATPIIAFDDFGTTVSSTAGTWTYTVNGSGLLSATAS